MVSDTLQPASCDVHLATSQPKLSLYGLIVASFDWGYRIALNFLFNFVNLA